jgi:3-oxoacyl-[acyl-carrier-protein] synthase-3
MPPDPRILGLAWHLPAREVSNPELAASIGGDADEIGARTGVARRYYASPGEGPSDLAVAATRQALEQAGAGVEDVGLVIFATMTPDVCFPGSACFLQDKLGAGKVGALDVRAQSAGFLCALDLATCFVAADGPDARYRFVVVAAGEVMSSGLDLSPRGADLTPRFGDGAAAAVVGPGERGARVCATRWYTDGTLVEELWCEYPASRTYPVRVTREDLRAGKHYPRANLARLAKVAVDALSGAAREVLEECGLGCDEVDAAVIDYIEPRVAREAAARIGLPAAKVTVPTADVGHVVGAGLPIGLARRSRELGTGSRVLLAAAGPGFTWGAALLET